MLNGVIAIAGKFINLTGLEQSQLVIMPKHPHRYLTEFGKHANFEHCTPLMNEDPMNLPKMYRIRQRFDNTKVKDIRETIKAELGGLSWSAIQPGQRVAITGGSRGIAHIAEILGAIVEFLKALEAEPFIFPAMGSHGGATAEGQVAMLEQLGMTEGSVQKGAEFYHKAAVQYTLEVALGCIGLIPAAKSKIVRIQNTLRLDTAEVSEAYAAMFQQRADLEIISGPDVMVFNGENNLP